MKRCTRCGQPKEPSEFYRRAASADGRQPACKKCTGEVRPSRAKGAVKVEPESLPARPALMVIGQLALEWGSERDAARVLALRAGGTWEAWERAIERWRETGSMTQEAADRLACATGHHIEELWAS